MRFIQLLILLYTVVCTVMWMETKLFRGFISDQFNNPIAGINKTTDELKLLVLYETFCLFQLNVLFLSHHSSVRTLWLGSDTKTKKRSWFIFLNIYNSWSVCWEELWEIQTLIISPNYNILDVLCDVFHTKKVLPQRIRSFGNFGVKLNFCVLDVRLWSFTL